MYCQVCGIWNGDEEQEYCRRCHQKLMVVSGPHAIEDQEAFDSSNPEEQMSFDEHLLERISILEEVARRTAETVRQTLGSLYKLEQKILVNQTGITTLRDLLESKRLIAHQEWSELWESRMDRQLLALEKRERFAELKTEIASLYRGDREDDFRKLLEHAEQALFAFDIEGALHALEDAHALDPANHELSFFLGETYFNEGDAAAALRFFQRVLQVKPKHFESLVYGGVLSHEQGDHERSEMLLKQAVAAHPDEFLPVFSLGAIHAARGRLAQAMAFLERAVAIDPLPQASYLLGNCCFEMGRTGAAIRYLKEATRQDPSYQEAYFLLGLAYLDRRWFHKAEEALDAAKRLNPHRLAYSELVGLLGPDDGDGDRGDGNHGDEESSTPPRREAQAALRLAEEQLGEGRIRQALTAYRRALSHDPDNPSLLLAYSMACLEIGRTQEAETVVGKVFGMDPGPRLRAAAYATWIEALRSEGNYREGNRIGQRLLEEGSDFAKILGYSEIALNLAEIEEDLEDAQRYAERAVELAPEALRRLPLEALGWVCYKRRDFAAAVTHLHGANQLQSSPRTLTHLGMAQLAAGERDAARGTLIDARRAAQQGGITGAEVLACLRDGARMLQELISR